MSIALTLHLLAVIIWVGGMFFTYMVLGRALNAVLEPQQRLPLLLRVFEGFFPWVWLSVTLILASGYWMLFVVYGPRTPFWLSFMTLAGTLMAAIFVFVYVFPYPRLGEALRRGEIPRAAAAVSLIRRLIATNLSLGLLVTLVAVLGKYGTF